MKYKEFEEKLEHWERFFKNRSIVLINADKSVDYTDLENLYRFIFKRNINNRCNNCYLDAVIELRNINEKIFKKMSELKYKLVPDKNFEIDGRFWSSLSIDFDNDVAEKILRVYGKSAFIEIKEFPKVKTIKTEAPVLVVKNEKKKGVKTAKKKRK